LASRAAQSESATPGKLPLDQRVWFATQIYATIQTYFGHWQAIPEFNLDTAYQKYLAQILPSDDRKNFDFATMELIAQLKNGHSTFWDQWLDDTYGQPLGFRLVPIDGQWVVIRSRVSGLANGDVVKEMDGRPIEQAIGDLERYVAASSEAVRQRQLFNYACLFPATFTITLDNGRTVPIDRLHQKLVSGSQPPWEEEQWLDDGIYYLYIPSFEEPKDEQTAVERLRRNAKAKAIIIDVRGNGGGNTPNDLINALMDRPYRYFSEGTSMSIGVFAAYRHILETVPADRLSDGDRASLAAVAPLARPMLVIGSDLKMPTKPVYTGPLVVLADGRCASSCEDFLMPIKEGKRGPIVGEASFGSTGQPYMVDLGDGMSFRVSTKRVYFPDGSPFEGVGIQPDVAAPRTLDDIRQGTDSALAKALEVARAAAKQGR
jgi:carboxyl-terminal processing protease